MRRREFIGGLGSAAAWPLPVGAAESEQVRRLAILTSGAENSEQANRIAVFRNALRRLGWIEGRQLRTEIWWGNNDLDLIAEQARTLVQTKPDVIFASPSSALLPLKNLTQTIPIVFSGVSDPVGQGIVSSLSRPDKNITGFSNLEFSLAGKWLQLLKDVAPVTHVAVMIATSNAVSERWFQTFHDVAPSFGVELSTAPLRERADIVRTIEYLGGRPNTGLIFPGDTFVEAPSNRAFVVDLAAKNRLPSLHSTRAYAVEGGLMSYGLDQNDQFLRAASYVDRILKGETPRDLPVQQPTKFEFVINLRTAKALNLSVPDGLLLAADEVIE